MIQELPYNRLQIAQEVSNTFKLIWCKKSADLALWNILAEKMSGIKCLMITRKIA